MSKQIIEISALDQVAGLIDALKTALCAHQVPKEMALDIRLALSETVNNALIHGNQQDCHKTVQVCWEFAETFFEFSVTDEGCGTSVETRTVNIITADNILQERGKGLYLTGQIMDEVWYNDLGNRINGRIRW